MINYIWLGLIVAAVAIALLRDTGWAPPLNNVVEAPAGEGHRPATEPPLPHLRAVTTGAFDAAKSAVTLALGLIGFFALWLGLMRLAEKGGLVQGIAWLVRPVMTRLFPDVPRDHPAMGAMVMNISANMLGLGNAATPLGIRAMEELDKLNPHKGTATNAMCTFLALNTSSVTLIPATVIAILHEQGSADPTRVIGPALAATTISTFVAIVAAKVFERWSPPDPLPAQTDSGSNGGNRDV